MAGSPINDFHEGDPAKAWALRLAFACMASLASALAMAAGPTVSGPDHGKPNAERPAPPVSTPGATRRATSQMLPLGLYLRDLGNDELQKLKLPSGVLVEEAIGLAGSSGVKQNDVIVSVNRNAVRNIDGFWALVEKSGWKFSLGVMRDSREITIQLDNTGAGTAK